MFLKNISYLCSVLKEKSTNLLPYQGSPNTDNYEKE